MFDLFLKSAGKYGSHSKFPSQVAPPLKFTPRKIHILPVKFPLENSILLKIPPPPSAKFLADGSAWKYSP